MKNSMLWKYNLSDTIKDLKLPWNQEESLWFKNTISASLDKNAHTKKSAIEKDERENIQNNFIQTLSFLKLNIKP